MGEAAEHLHPAPDRQDRAVKPVLVDTEPAVGVRRQKSAAWHWRVDLKWVFGIPFTIILFTTLVVVSLFGATGRDNAVATLSAMNRPLLAEQGFQDELGARAPELAALLRSPDFAANIYSDPGSLDQAIDAVPDSPPLPENVPPETAGELGEGQQNGLKSALRIYSTPVRVFSADVHTVLGQMLTVQLVLLLLTGIPFILFSRRAGRLVSPAVSLALVSWAPLLIVTAMHSSLVDWIAARQAESAGRDQQMLAEVMKPFADGLFGSVAGTYRFFAFAAVTLLLVATTVFVILKTRERLSA